MKHKVAIVTGHKQGIGAAIYHELLARGVRVYGFDLPEHDITQFDSIPLWVKQVVEKEGGIDFLVNNAGINVVGTLLETSIEALDEVFSVNFKAAYAFMQAVIPTMIGKKAGAIVNIASDQALSAKKYAAAYGASKAALLQLSKSTALDFAKYGIRVNALCPGSTQTQMTEAILQTLCERYPDEFSQFEPSDFTKEAPLERFADPLDIARSAVFLLSDDASFMTGCAMSVDGGVTAQ